MEALKNDVQEIADMSGFDIRIISIKKTPKKGHYAIFYVSREAKNDWHKYVELLIKLSCISTAHVLILLRAF